MAKPADYINWTDAPLPNQSILVASFRGWNDAGGSASAALMTLAKEYDQRLLAEIDPEEFFDFQDVRPQIKLEDGNVRAIEWPRNPLFAIETPGGSPDLVLLHGMEPSLKWKTFCSTILAVARQCEVAQVVTMGALLADVPHTRPTTVTGFSSDPSLAARLNLRRSNYEGPTGITGVLHAACAGQGIPSCSLWAAVPHYIAATPNPMAAMALLSAFEEVAGFDVDIADLEVASERYQEQVSSAVASDEEIAGYVRALEENADAETLELGTIPSGDLIAREFQRFLRERGRDERRRDSDT